MKHDPTLQTPHCWIELHRDNQTISDNDVFLDPAAFVSYLRIRHNDGTPTPITRGYVTVLETHGWRGLNQIPAECIIENRAPASTARDVTTPPVYPCLRCHREIGPLNPAATDDGLFGCKACIDA